MMVEHQQTGVKRIPEIGRKSLAGRVRTEIPTDAADSDGGGSILIGIGIDGAAAREESPKITRFRYNPWDCSLRIPRWPFPRAPRRCC